MVLFMYIYLIAVDLFLYLYIWTGFYEDRQAKICAYKGRYKTSHITALVFEVNLPPLLPFLLNLLIMTLENSISTLMFSPECGLIFAG